MPEVGAPTRALLTCSHVRAERVVAVRRICWMISSQLPVQRDVVLGVVGDADDDAVAFPGDELGAGELPVHRDDLLGLAQPLH